jgi:hypothetical protein
MSHAQRDELCRQIKAQLSGMSWLDGTFSSDSPFGQDFLPETDHCEASLLTIRYSSCATARMDGSFALHVQNVGWFATADRPMSCL